MGTRSWIKLELFVPYPRQLKFQWKWKRCQSPPSLTARKTTENRGFSLKTAWKLHDFEEILGTKAPPGSATDYNLAYYSLFKPDTWNVPGSAISGMNPMFYWSCLWFFLVLFVFLEVALAKLHWSSLVHFRVTLNLQRHFHEIFLSQGRKEAGTVVTV